MVSDSQDEFSPCTWSCDTYVALCSTRSAARGKVNAVVQRFTSLISLIVTMPSLDVWTKGLPPVPISDSAEGGFDGEVPPREIMIMVCV